MSDEGRTAPGQDGARLEEWARRGFWLLLAASWVIAVWYMWDAMSTVPSACSFK